MRSFTTAEIEHKIRTASFSDDRITLFACHTQAVERMVRVVTEAAAEVCGMENRVFNPRKISLKEENGQVCSQVCYQKRLRVLDVAVILRESVLCLEERFNFTG